MNNLEVGKIYTNGKLKREITKIDNNEIYYKTDKGTEKQCWITTFQDWVKKGEKRDDSIEYKYEIIYSENKNEYITTLGISDINIAKETGKNYKGRKDTTNVKIIEFKTTERIIEI